jgi:hypothetical protein
MTKLRLVVYDKTTGNRLYDCVFFDNFIEPTIEQIHTVVPDLQPFDVNYLGLLRFENGQYDDNFAKYPFHVDVTNQSIVWDTANPIGASLQDIQNAKIAQLRDMFTQTLCSGFKSSADGTERTYGYTPTNYEHSDQSNMNKVSTQILMGTATFPIPYADIIGSPVPLNQAQFTQLVTDAGNFELAQTEQLRSLIGQVQQATTTDEVNTIQWAPATY